MKEDGEDKFYLNNEDIWMRVLVLQGGLYIRNCIKNYYFIRKVYFVEVLVNSKTFYLISSSNTILTVFFLYHSPGVPLCGLLCWVLFI